MRYSEPYHNAVALQRAIMASHRTCAPKDLAALGKTFVNLEMLKLRIKMRPAPKPVDVEKLAENKRKRKALTPVEPSET
jgi:hypothetical protein